MDYLRVPGSELQTLRLAFRLLSITKLLLQPLAATEHSLLLLSRDKEELKDIPHAHLSATFSKKFCVYCGEVGHELSDCY